MQNKNCSKREGTTKARLEVKSIVFRIKEKFLDKPFTQFINCFFIVITHFSQKHCFSCSDKILPFQTNKWICGGRYISVAGHPHCWIPALVQAASHSEYVMSPTRTLLIRERARGEKPAIDFRQQTLLFRNMLFPFRVTAPLKKTLI